MTNTTTIPPAIARLLALGPLPSQMSARAAADVLGGAHRLEYVLHLVEVGDLASWTHSPTHGDQWHWKGRCGNEKILPRIATDTDPDAVRVSGEGVLWHWCVLLEEAIHGRLPPKDAVEQRLAQVRNLQREHALGTLAAPTEDAPQAVPAESSASTRPDYSMLATRAQLIQAFGAFTGMDLTWFDNLKDTPALLDARKVTGRGGRGHLAEPRFCPFKVMQWLVSGKRKKGRPLSLEKAWELLERHFPRVHSAHSAAAPRAGD